MNEWHQKPVPKIIDLYSVTEDHADWYSDGLHPNADGNKAIAQAIYEQIKNK